MPKPADNQDQAIAQWMQAYGAGLRRYLRRRAHPDDIEDLLQETFRKLHVGKPGAEPSSFTFTVARSVLLDYQRERHARQVDAHDPFDTVSDNFVDAFSPERIIIGRQEYDRAVEAILALPPRVRAAFQFHRFEDMTYEAIAERMGISRNSVKELIGRGLVALSRAMGDSA